MLVNEEQAQILANLEQNGKIHLALVHRGNDEKKQELLEKQKSIFSNDNMDNLENITIEENIIIEEVEGE